MTQDPGCRCCRCTGTAGTAHRVALGCHSNQGHTGHSGTLGDKREKKTISFDLCETSVHISLQNHPQCLHCHHHHQIDQLKSQKWWITSVSLSAVTDDLVGGVVSLTGVAVKVIRAGVTRAGAGPTVLPWAEHRVSKESIHATGTNETFSISLTRWMKRGTDCHGALLTAHRGVLLCSPCSLYTPRCGSHRGLRGHYTDRGCSWGSPTGLVGSLSTDAPWLPACTGTGL